MFWDRETALIFLETHYPWFIETFKSYPKTVLQGEPPDVLGTPHHPIIEGSADIQESPKCRQAKMPQHHISAKGALERIDRSADVAQHSRIHLHSHDIDNVWGAWGEH